MHGNMNTSQIEIILVDHWNTEEIISLYKSGNWWNEEADVSIIPQLIKNSYAFAIAVNKQLKKAVGMGRVLSDGISDAYIQDVVVLHEWRGKGIGKRIIQKLVTFCLSKRINWIALISEPHQEEFYLPLGFKEMKHYVPMKYDLM